MNLMSDSTRPTRTRFVLVAWLCGLSGVLYLDRVCMGQAAPAIQEELGLSNTQLSYVMMAFSLAYGLFEIPTGRLGDRYGSRRVLTRIVVWWSLFTALTGACSGLITLIIVRFLFGAGEAGAFPNVARVLSRWFNTGERGRVQGALLTASQLGGVAAPTVAAFLIAGVGWRWTFAIFGVVGIVWAVGFWFWFRDDPKDHPKVNEAELEQIGTADKPPVTHHEPIPWRYALTNPGIWLLGTAIVCSTANTYLYQNWFPKYLMAAHGLENKPAGLLTSLVLAGLATGVLTGGVIADRIHRKSAAPDRSRRLLGAFAYLGAAGFLTLAVQMESSFLLALFASLSCFCVQLTLPTWWSCAIEQSGRHVGSLFGLMNMMGVVGGLTSQWYVGRFSDYQKSLGLSGRAQWDPLFDAFIGVLVLGAIAWSLYPGKPAERT